MDVNRYSDASFGISVVLPVFMPEATPDAVRLLGRALKSIVAQDFPGPFEILLIDDGCPKPLTALLDEGAIDYHPSIRVLRLAQNSGIVRALNTGIKHARYPYIARIDSDDFWAPGKIAHQYAQLKGDPDLTLSATGMTRYDSAGELIDTHIRKDGWAEVIKFVVDVGCPFPHGSVLARTDIYRLLGGYSLAPAARHIEDFDLWSRWIRFFAPGMVEKSFYNYTVSAQSISVLNSQKQGEESYRISSRIRALRLDRVLPSAIAALAEAAQVSKIQAGMIAYKIWQHPIAVRLPVGALKPLGDLLPDRNIQAVSGQAMSPIWDIDDLVTGYDGPPMDRVVTAAVRALPL